MNVKKQREDYQKRLTIFVIFMSFVMVALLGIGPLI